LLAISAAPAFAAGPRMLTLVDISHWAGKGLVLKFEVSGGEYSESELTGYAEISGREFGLDCNIDDDGRVACVIGDAIAQFVGRSAAVVVAGEGFWITVPGRLEPNYCYNIYGLMTDDFDGFVEAFNDDEYSLTESLFEYWYPAQVGYTCSAESPMFSDMINFDHAYEAQLAALFGDKFEDYLMCREDESDCMSFDMTSAIFLDETWLELLRAGDPEADYEACYLENLTGTPAYYGMIYLELLPFFHECDGFFGT